ncbi:glycosyltransferase family 4 protein [Lactobacillus paragasseri]|uniref:glycosyltransferase family 4 protein n=1 Tax=Lactobacillus paragasseri TaxID=2107999 RepID=UPI0012E0E22D|nr:glycosyltransferase family 4 protein [Lactobacillus paragasseri]MDK8087283.1 glycosyltransferase family 4 protein [Lactobacillus paragasseri]MDX5119212.1 glycosyltransferase family 4 protein [Lactobacillus paragasseri]MDX5123097.1 glycosyltransferase family 4 protein [Lactobacillus paragasseri]QGT98276.1 glycosyltransferase family 4 protein [Lactobacillus paragasseri]UWI44142.1 glycosyltransferase family 4 protein [Lactobacillus paragasseri]
MNIGLFTDTYFPQLSGVATSIQTLKNALEKNGHSVFIFTTTDPHLGKGTIEPNVFRVSSVPFVSFTDRRIAFRGLFQATKIAKEVKLDIVHTQTEFSMGMIGKYVAHSLGIPAIHTYHTMYEDYLHYVLNGHLLKPYHVKQFTKAYLHNMDGVVAPSERVKETLTRYGVTIPMRIIPTGVDLTAINENPRRDVRKELGIDSNKKVILTLSRVAAEKKIDQILDVLPTVLESEPNVKFVIAGDGPDVQPLKDQVARLSLEDYVIFAGSVEHSDVGNYYRMADLFVSASDTETQGLTYIEALAAGTKCVVYSTDYTEHVFDNKELGSTFTTKNEMTNEIIDYLKANQFTIPKNLKEKKLIDVSADTFAHKIEDFYQEAIQNKQKTEVNYD